MFSFFFFYFIDTTLKTSAEVGPSNGRNGTAFFREVTVKSQFQLQLSLCFRRPRLLSTVHRWSATTVPSFNKPTHRKITHWTSVQLVLLLLLLPKLQTSAGELKAAENICSCCCLLLLSYFFSTSTSSSSSRF